MCGTPQNDGDREDSEEEEEGHTDTDRPGLRPRLHSYTDEASRRVGVAGVGVRVPVVTDNVRVRIEVTVRRVHEQAVVRLGVGLVRVWTCSS